MFLNSRTCLALLTLISAGACDRNKCDPGAKRCSAAGFQETCSKNDVNITYWVPEHWCTDLCQVVNGESSCQPLPSLTCGSVSRPDLPGSTVQKVDINRDGVPDLVFAGFGAKEMRGLRISLGNADGTFGPADLATTETRPTASWKVVDVNGDGFEDILIVVAGSGFPVVLHLGDGAGNFSLVPTAGLSAYVSSPDLLFGNLDTTPGKEVIVVADPFFDPDGKPQMIGHWRNNQLIFVEPPELKRHKVFDVADLEGVGQDQLLAFTASSLWSFRLQGETLIEREVGGPNAEQVAPLKLVDLNRDGLPEVVFVGTSVVVLSFQKSARKFRAIKTPNLVFFADGTSTLDVNGDGLLDLVASNIDGVTISLAKSDLTFAPSTLVQTPNGATTPLGMGDFDGDGVADLLAEKQTDAANEVPIVISGTCSAFRASP